MINLLELLSACIDLAEKAAEIIREVATYDTIEVHMKSVDDPMTIADLRAQALIEGGIRKVWSDITLIGEETTQYDTNVDTPNIHKFDNEVTETQKLNFQVPIKDLVMYVDPLDGTQSFTDKENESVSVLIGGAINGTAILGVVQQPFIGTTHWGLKGFRTEVLSRTISTRNYSDFIFCTTKSHYTPLVEKVMKTLNPKQILRVGGAGYKSILVLQGTVDVYVYPTPGTSKWDTCAVQALIESYGGKLTDRFGRIITYNLTDNIKNLDGVVASIRHHDEVINLIKDIQQ